MTDKIIIPKISALMAQRCPHCHKGKVFTHSTFSFGFMKMHDHCPVCDQKFEIEPGFFWGSMYISYFLTVFVGLAVGVTVFLVIDNPSVFQVISCICVALAILTPFSFRFSRLVMLYSFASIKFDPEAGR